MAAVASEMNLPLERVAAGLIPGCSLANIRGYNAAISNSAETVWAPGSTYATLTSGVAMEAVSSDAADAAAGTGARTIVVSGVTGAGAAFSETVTLNGATPVALTNTSVVGINRVYVATAGSGLVNAGSVDVRVVSGAAVKARISADAVATGQSTGFIYTLPSTAYGLLKSISWSATGVTGDVTVYLISRNSVGVERVEAVSKSSLYVTGFNGAMNTFDLGAGLYIAASSMIELRAIASAGAGVLVANAQMLIVTAGVSNGLQF